MSLPDIALSVMQPWAWLIVNGHKDIENRTWRTHRRGPVLIHAGKKIDGDAHQALLRGEHPASFTHDLPDSVRLAYQRDLMAGKIDKGGIVGVATITGCADRSASPWFVGTFGFTLTDARPLDFMPLKGALQFFPATYDPAPEPGN